MATASWTWQWQSTRHGPTSNNVGVLLGNGDGTFQPAGGLHGRQHLPTRLRRGTLMATGEWIWQSPTRFDSVSSLLQSAPTGGAAQLVGGNTFTGNQTVNGAVTATSFVGDGSGLTGVNAATATNATNAAELGGVAAAKYARLDISNSFTGNQSIAGNMGIGTTTPAFALDVVGHNAGLRLSGTGTHQVTVTGATSGRLGQDAGGFFFASDTKGKHVRFLTNNGTLNEWMRVTSAGNVGIGTMTPAAKLDVAGGINSSGGDVSTTTAGRGLIVKSPDGTKCARIGINNNGAIVATSVTCP